MIKRLPLLFTVSIIITGLTGATGKPRSADEIINKYIKARGGYKKLKAIKTLRMTGTYQEGKNTFGTYIEWKRPWFRVVVVGVPDEFYREGFNGTSWEYSLPTKALKITEPSSAAGTATRRGAEFDESIIDYRAKGHRVYFVGQERLAGKNVYHLRVTLRDGWAKDYYLDTESYLIVALRKAMPLHATGPDIESLTMYEDYRSVAGVLYPHSFVERNTRTGAILNTLHWKEIEANVEIDDRQFDPPTVKSPEPRSAYKFAALLSIPSLANEESLSFSATAITRDLTGLVVSQKSETGGRKRDSKQLYPF